MKDVTTRRIDRVFGTPLHDMIGLQRADSSVEMEDSSRWLLVNQDPPLENGVYVVKPSGESGHWMRPAKPQWPGRNRHERRIARAKARALRRAG